MSLTCLLWLNYFICVIPPRKIQLGVTQLSSLSRDLGTACNRDDVKDLIY